jgi:hypothetical protein
MEKLPAKPGDSLVNVLACFPDLEQLKRDFQILYFLDFCAGLDALVLHERLFALGPVRSATGTDNPVVPELLKSGTLKSYQLLNNGYEYSVLRRKNPLLTNLLIK